MSSSNNSKENKTTNEIRILPNFALKAKYAFYSTLVFFLIANPETFKLTQRLFGSLLSIASESGCPTAYGFFFHAFLFFLVLWAMMLFPRDP